MQERLLTLTSAHQSLVQGESDSASAALEKSMTLEKIDKHIQYKRVQMAMKMKMKGVRDVCQRDMTMVTRLQETPRAAACRRHDDHHNRRRLCAVNARSSHHIHNQYNSNNNNLSQSQHTSTRRFAALLQHREKLLFLCSSSPRHSN